MTVPPSTPSPQPGQPPQPAGGQPGPQPPYPAGPQQPGVRPPMGSQYPPNASAYRPGYQPAAAPAAKPRKPIVPLVIGLVVLAMVGGGIYTAVQRSNDLAIYAEAGDCLPETVEGERTYVVDCDADEAVYQVLGTADDVATCADMPGTSHSFTADETYLCMAEVGADLTMALNTVVVGDCLVTTGEGESAGIAKSACESGALPVLAVLHDVPQSEMLNPYDSPCDDVAPETEYVGRWMLERPDVVPVGQTFDYVYCLGAELP